MSALTDFFKQQKSYYGPWIARVETKRYMEQTLLPAKSYRRYVRTQDYARLWREAHAYGQKLASAFGRKDYETLLSEYNDNFGVLRNVISSGQIRKLRARVETLRDAYGDTALTRCACCDGLGVRATMVLDVGNYLICSRCVSSERVQTSRIMGGYIIPTNAYSAYTSQEAAAAGDMDWVTRDFARNNRYTLHHGNYYAPGAYDISTQLNDTLYGYHSGPDLGHIPSAYDSRKPRILLGMELEIECNEDVPSDDDDDDDSPRAYYAKKVVRALNGVTKGFAKAETDGSLDNGFEIITGYTGLDVHEKTWRALADVREGLESHDTDTCGLHVHVDKAGMTPLHMAKLCTFVNDPVNRELMTTVARRYADADSHGYAKFYTRENWLEHAAFAAREYRSHRQFRSKGDRFEYGRFATSRFWSDRYSALNFNNEHTVEFRMFRGTLKFESIMACLEFTFACWHFTKETPMKSLTTDAFMAFITRADNRKDTKYLRAYLKAKKFRAFYQAERVARPKFKEEEPSARDQNNRLYDDAHNVVVRERCSAPQDFTLAA